MIHYDFIPRKDADFINWINNFILNLGNMINKANFPTDRYEKIIVLKNSFTEKFVVSENPVTRTSISIQAKNIARDELEKEVRRNVKEFLTYSSYIDDTDRSSLGLMIHKKSRTPSPVAVTYPDFDIDSSIIRRLSIHYYDTGKQSKAKPEGQHGVEIRWAILDSQPENVSNLVNSAFDTRTPYTIEFEESQRGKTVYLCLCWENTRGEKGPWSEIMSAIVP